jgi:hypothetical protein
LQITDLLVTDTEWEYHKIIAKHNPGDKELTLVVSGRKPDCSEIGFSTLNDSFGIINNYRWGKNTERESHVVVCDYFWEYNKIVLASSYQTKTSLYPITFPVSPFTQIAEYQFTPPPPTSEARYCVQDIGMFKNNDAVKPTISVAGYIERGLVPTRSIAWHGNTPVSFSAMSNNFFGELGEWWKHYKIGYNEKGKEYTGGLFNNGFSNCALFGTPLEVAEKCDNRIEYPMTSTPQHFWYSFGLIPRKSLPRILDFYNSPIEMPVYKECLPFKGNEAPDFVIPSPKNETEITNFYDRITVKDTPSGTNYQIFSVTGQLIQTGTTNPDISTAQLTKGMYILRLEDGKAVKFVK